MERTEQQRLPVAFFDSGLGGISVLRQTVKLLPNEDYLYYGDSLHAPYGVRDAQEVIRLCDDAVQLLLARGIKALVIACNTATSAAAHQLRKKYPELPIIGTEPAVKPAVERHPGGRILVMATPMTLKEEKFSRLREQYEDEAEIIPVPCGGLMEYVEQGVLRGEAVENYLLDKLEPYMKVPVSAVVLGCTHYPFLTGAIRRIVGRIPEILDGSLGVATQLRRKLDESGLRNPSEAPGHVEFLNSLDEPEMLELSRSLFAYQDED